MTVELTAEQMELILHALREHRRRQQEQGVPATGIDNLLAHLKLVERENLTEKQGD